MEVDASAQVYSIWTISETGVRANILSPSMFIAIIGTRFSGRTTIESYLIAKGFLPVRVIAQALDYEARVGDYGEVSHLRACLYLVSLPNTLLDISKRPTTLFRGCG